MHTDIDDPNDSPEVRWLKFQQDKSHCPECGLWDVEIRVMNNNSYIDPNAKRFWRWSCNHCTAIWFDPNRVAMGSYMKKFCS